MKTTNELNDILMMNDKYLVGHNYAVKIVVK